MKDIDYNQIAERIREIRIQRRLTQDYLAEAADVNQSHINNIENHRAKISLPTLVHVCNAMNVTVDYILCGEYPDPGTALEIEIQREVRQCSNEDKERILRVIRALYDV